MDGFMRIELPTRPTCQAVNQTLKRGWGWGWGWGLNQAQGRLEYRLNGRV